MKHAIAATLFLLCAASAGAQQLPFNEAIARLARPDASERLQALGLLEESGYPESGAPIAALLADPDERVRRAALYAELSIFFAARMETRRRIGGFIEVGDFRPAERLFDTAWAALPIAPVPPEVFTGVLELTRHQDPVFRSEAIFALGLLAQVDGRPPTPAHRRLAEGMADRLGDTAPETRAAIARAAGRIFRLCPGTCEQAGITRLGDALVHTLNDPDRRVRMAALAALGDMRWERAVSGLIESYQYFQGKPDGLAYLATLARIGHASSVPLFKSALASRDSNYRLVGGEGLARAGGEGAATAAETLREDRSSAVRIVSAFAAARGGQAAGIDRLLRALDFVETRAQAQEYLIDLGPAAVGPATASLARGGADKRRALVEVLSVNGGSSELATLEPLQRDGNAQLAAAAERAVARIKARLP